MKTQEERSATTMSLSRDLGGEGVTRRRFMGGMGAVMASAAAMAAGISTAHADEAAEAEEAVEEEAVEETEEEAIVEEAAEEEEAEDTTAGDFSNYPTIESVTGWTGTPDDVLAVGLSTMPLDDLNQYRKAYLDAQSDYTKEDGTVIPAVFVKVRALIHTYGYGCGNTPSDASFDDIVNVFSEDDAQAFIDMPMGVEFTAYEMAAEEGREVDECTEICDRLAEEGYLCAYDTNRGRCYHQVPVVVGVAEYHVDDSVESDNTFATVTGSDVSLGLGNCGVPPLYYVPVDASVTSSGTILPYDDIKEKARNTSVACITPCYCRYCALAGSLGYENIPSIEDFLSGEYEDYFSELTDERVETCIYFGDEAQYWIDRGLARQITGEQAAEYIQRSVDDGFMLEATYEKGLTVVCSCSADSCGLVAQWLALGDSDTIASYNAFQQVSHYTLEVDADKCIACGTCVDRCPLHIISINDEGWAEPAANCFRCGQCAYVCPQEARKLVERDESELAELPNTHLDLNNQNAAWRFEMGYITFPEATATEETAETEETETEETVE